MNGERVSDVYERLNLLVYESRLSRRTLCPKRFGSPNWLSLAFGATFLVCEGRLEYRAGYLGRLALIDLRVALADFASDPKGNVPKWLIEVLCVLIQERSTIRL